MGTAVQNGGVSEPEATDSDDTPPELLAFKQQRMLLFSASTGRTAGIVSCRDVFLGVVQDLLQQETDPAEITLEEAEKEHEARLEELKAAFEDSAAEDSA